MKHIFCLFLLSFIYFNSQAQHSVKIFITNKVGQPLNRATAVLSPGNKTVIADSTGTATFASMVQGAYTVKISYVGMEEKEIPVIIPLPADEPIQVVLEEGEEEEEEIIITSTRTSR